MLAHYSKALAAVTTGVIGWGMVVVASNPASVTAAEWMELAVVGATALGVYGVPNPPRRLIVSRGRHERG